MLETCEFNRIERNEGTIGVICCGATYQHVARGAAAGRHPEAWHVVAASPKKIREFAASVENVYVIEEGSDYLSEGVRALGVQLSEPEGTLCPDGELTLAPLQPPLALRSPSIPRCATICQVVRRRCVQAAASPCVPRLSRMKAIVTGDIDAIRSVRSPAFRDGHLCRHGRVHFHEPRL